MLTLRVQPGGLNFDCKLRRESTDLEDLFIGHIGAMVRRAADDATCNATCRSHVAFLAHFCMFHRRTTCHCANVAAAHCLPRIAC